MDRTKKILRRLRHVAEHVINYRRMDMRSWLKHGFTPTPHLQKDGTPDPHGCGTSACFLGWAIAGDKRFRKLTGISLVWNDSADFYKPYAGLQKLPDVLGIGDEAFFYLFSPNKSGKKRHLLARLKEVEKDPFAFNYPYKP